MLKLRMTSIPRTLWILSEQGMHSLYSFFVVVIAARLMSVEVFGAFSLVWNLYPVILLIITALYTKPLAISYYDLAEYDRECEESFGYWIGSVLILLSLMAVMVGVINLVYEIDEITVISMFGVAILFLRSSHEVYRRILYVRTEFVSSFFITFFSFLPFGVVVVIYYFGLYENIEIFNGSSYLTAVCLIYLIAMLYFSKSLFPNISSISGAWANLAIYARPLMYAASLEVVLKRTAPYIMVLGAGLVEGGVWAIARLLIGPPQIVLTGLISSALPPLREAFVKFGSYSMFKLLGRYFVILLVLYFFPLIIIGCFASDIIGMVVGEEYKSAGSALQIYTVAFLVMGLNSLAGVLLNAIGEVRQQIVLSVVTGVAYLVGSVFIYINSYGAEGVATLAFISEILALIVLSIFLWDRFLKEKIV